MSLDLAIRPVPPQEVSRQSFRAAGPDRAAGSAPPAPPPEIGPANPRLRMDLDLGIVVIEFRDTTGQVTTSVPTPRELEAYRAAIIYGASLPSYVSPNNQGIKALLKAGPAIPSIDLAPPPPGDRFLKDAIETNGLDRVA